MLEDGAAVDIAQMALCVFSLRREGDSQWAVTSYVDKIVKDIFRDIEEELRSSPDHGLNYEDSLCAEMASAFMKELVPSPKDQVDKDIPGREWTAFEAASGYLVVIGRLSVGVSFLVRNDFS